MTTTGTTYHIPQTPPPLPLPLPLAAAEKTTDTEPWVRASASCCIYIVNETKNYYELRITKTAFFALFSEEAIIKSALRKPIFSRLPPGTGRGLSARDLRTSRRRGRRTRSAAITLPFWFSRWEPLCCLRAWDIIQSIIIKKMPRQVTGGLVNNGAFQSAKTALSI